MVLLEVTEKYNYTEKDILGMEESVYKEHQLYMESKGFSFKTADAMRTDDGGEGYISSKFQRFIEQMFNDTNFTKEEIANKLLEDCKSMVTK